MAATKMRGERAARHDRIFRMRDAVGDNAIRRFRRLGSQIGSAAGGVVGKRRFGSIEKNARATVLFTPRQLRARSRAR